MTLGQDSIDNVDFPNDIEEENVKFYVVRYSLFGTSCVVLCEHDTLEDAQKHAKVQRGRQSHVWTVLNNIPEDARSVIGLTDMNDYLPYRDSLHHFLFDTDDREGWHESTVVL